MMSKSIFIGAGLVALAIVLVACAPTQVQVVSETSALMPRPDRIYVYNFAVSPDEVILDHGIPKEKASPQKGKPAVYREKAGTLTATVQAIDLAKRIVTVRGGPKKQLVELKVDEKVKNLSKLKVGDEVVVKYFASVAVQVNKPGDVKDKESMEKTQVVRPGAETHRLTVTNSAGH
jgi:hypothetical protein